MFPPCVSQWTTPAAHIAHMARSISKYKAAFNPSLLFFFDTVTPGTAAITVTYHSTLYFSCDGSPFFTRPAKYIVGTRGAQMGLHPGRVLHCVALEVARYF